MTEGKAKHRMRVLIRDVALMRFPRKVGRRGAWRIASRALLRYDKAPFSNMRDAKETAIDSLEYAENYYQRMPW